MIRHTLLLGCLVLVGLAVGCSSKSPNDKTAARHQPSAEGQQYLLQAEPEGAQDIIAAHEQSQNEQDVTVIGRIGGSTDPWIEGRSAFSVVDRSLAACSDIPGDDCPTPWDYCCRTDKLPGATALVKVVDADGKLIPTDARELLGLHELQTVVVQGKAQRDDAGNMTILASAIYAHDGDLGQHPAAGGNDHSGHDHEHSEEEAHGVEN